MGKLRFWISMGCMICRGEGVMDYGLWIMDYGLWIKKKE